jgi:hypothetical protein
MKIKKPGERHKRVVKKIVKSGKFKGKKGLIKFIENYTKDPQTVFEKYRRIFYMIDVCPENDTRFKIDYRTLLDESDLK